LDVGLDLLLSLLASTNTKYQQDGSVALYKLANKAMTLSPMDAAPPSPTPQVCFFKNAKDASSNIHVNNVKDIAFTVDLKYLILVHDNYFVPAL